MPLRKFPKRKKGADPIGTFRRGARRAPNYVWLSEKSREARSTAIDFYNLKF
jgi:hypothetical protein